MEHTTFQHHGNPTCRRCGRWGTQLTRYPECNPPRPLTEADWERFAEQNHQDRAAWTSYALSHPETPVHEDETD
jgi:hypothetical protein